MSLVVLGQIARGWRVGLMATPESAPSFNAYRISTLHNFFASALPARLGEAALPVMLKRTYGTSIASGSAILLAARTLDLLIILSVCGFTFWTVVPSESILGPLRGVSLFGGGLALCLYIGLPWTRQLCCQFVASPVSNSKGKAIGLAVRMLTAVSEIPLRKFFSSSLNASYLVVSL